MTLPERDVLIAMLSVMLRGRAFEEASIVAFQRDAIPGFEHVGIGQEAVAAGVSVHLRRDDYIFTNHRGHVHAIAKGVDPRALMAELFGKPTGLCRGRAGSMHSADPAVGLLGASGIVGAGLPIATGIALSNQLRHPDRVTICYFGDGAVNEGVFHESLNVASLWQLPIVYCCENNGWAEFTAQAQTTRVTDVARRAAAYDMPGVTADGDDPVTVYDAAGDAIARARGGGGPTLLECKTHRWQGHFIGDPQQYRPREDIEASRGRDPIPRFESRLLETGVLTAGDVARLRRDAQCEIEAAVRFAEDSAFSGYSDLLDNVYFDPAVRR